MFILVLLYNHFHGNYLTQCNYPMFLHPYILVLPKVPTPHPSKSLTPSFVTMTKISMTVWLSAF